MKYKEDCGRSDNCVKPLECWNGQCQCADNKPYLKIQSPEGRILEICQETLR